MRFDSLVFGCWVSAAVAAAAAAAAAGFKENLEKMGTYLEGIAGQVDRFLPFLQGASPLDWAACNGVLRGHEG